MNAKLRAFGAFWYDFVIGDDWRVAVGVTLAFAITYVASRSTSAPLWWIAPLAVVILLPVSIYRVTRSNKT
jgi:multisubunit Na+/H+ antiporter MnhE subunit